MKRNKALFAALTAVVWLGFTACSNDDNEDSEWHPVNNDLYYVASFDNQKAENIVHTQWNTSGYVYKVNESGDSDNGYYEVAYIDYSEYTRYKADGTGMLAPVLLFKNNARAAISKEEYDLLGIPLGTNLSLSLKLTNLGRYYEGLDERTDINAKGNPLGIPYGSVLPAKQWPSMPIQRKAYLISAQPMADNGSTSQSDEE
ncbi:MAG: hypothetical protein IJ196_02790 [Prevotella sp.]|nr:hypothetical protein [Prevotella sp.]